jgi:uncharacterized protein YndB with AHSA1/START domain
MATQSSAAGDAGLVTRPSLTLKRRLHAPPEKVYAAWTDPKKIARWFGPSQVQAGSVHAVIDARIGGRFRISFTNGDGEHHEVGGVYREERESLVTVSLKADGGGTLLTLHHEALFDQAARDDHERGWNAALDKLEKYLA